MGGAVSSHKGRITGHNGFTSTKCEGGAAKKYTTLGIDGAKQVFHLHGVADRGAVVMQKRVSRTKLLQTVAQLPACVIGMEACSSAQYSAQEFQKFGHTVKLISPQFVKPYVTGNKNDSRDAEAICEADCAPHARVQVLLVCSAYDRWDRSDACDSQGTTDGD